MQKLLLVLLAVTLLAWAPAAMAQGTASGNILATANVMTSITVTSEQNLDFGNVIPGTPKSVAITGVTAGRWLVQGTPTAQVNLDFTTLPATLTDGTNTMPIVYGATDAGHNTTNNPNGAVLFDPAGTALGNLGNPGASLYVWIGGTVQPGAVQPAGFYSGTITLTATYTGN
jgi:hypothetical protein